MTEPTTQKQPMSGNTKILLGCGCLGFFALILTGVLFLGGMMAFFKGKEEFDKVSERLESTPGADRVAGRSRGAEDGDGSGQEGQGEEMNPQDWYKKAISPKEVANYLAFRKAWAASNHAKSMEKGTDAIKALEKDSKGGMMDSLRAIKATKDIVVGLGGVNGEGEKIAQKYGGSSGLFGDYVRMMALVAAARAVGEKEGTEPFQDAVATAMVARQPEAKVLHTKWKEGMADQVEVMRMMRDPDWAKKANTPEMKQRMEESGEMAALPATEAGVLVLAKIPASSLATWKGLDEQTRKEIFEKHLDPPFSSVFGFAPGMADAIGFKAETFVAWEMGDALTAMQEETLKNAVK